IFQELLYDHNISETNDVTVGEFNNGERRVVLGCMIALLRNVKLLIPLLLKANLNDSDATSQQTEVINSDKCRTAETSKR
ncbi:hypothetical protein KSF78_0005811, partial [Schistosoma japonicum]